MNPREVHQAIWKKFHVHHYDNLPYEGWWNSTRETIYELWGELGFKVGAEVGVRMGRNSEAIINRVPGVKLYLCDPWGAYNRVTDSTQQVYLDRCQRRLKGKNVEYLQMIGREGAKKIPDDSLDFVYIDGNHAGDYVMEDMITWTPKVKVGGIVSGHDYFSFYQAGVIPAVDAYTMGNNIERWYITREKAPSWFFVREQ